LHELLLAAKVGASGLPVTCDISPCLEQLAKSIRMRKKFREEFIKILLPSAIENIQTLLAAKLVTSEY
jgi:hypothetical protein